MLSRELADVSPCRSPRSGALPAMLGGIIWVAFLIGTAAGPFGEGWGAALLLLAPLVLVPLGMGLGDVGEESPWARRFLGWARAGQLPAALCLGTAFCLDQGGLAFSLALPWLIVTLLMAGRGLSHPRMDQLGLGATCVRIGWIYIAVGGAWAAADRLGYRPLNFDPVIVLLTANHFHYAGFVLPLATGLGLAFFPGLAGRLAGVGVILGVPFVAVGITASHLGAPPWIEVAAAWWMALAGTLAGWLHLRLAFQPGWPGNVRLLWAVAGLSLMASMVLAALYGGRFLAPLPWLDIPWMRALHGTANALGFGFLAVAGWWSCQGPGRENRQGVVQAPLFP